MAEFSSIERQTDLTVDKTRYISDDKLRSLCIWKERVRRFFFQRSIRMRSTIE